MKQHHNSSTSCYRDITSLYTWTLLWKIRVLSFRVFCACHSTFERRKFLEPTAVKLSLHSFDRNRSHSVSTSGRLHSSISVSARERYGESVSTSKSSKVQTSPNLLEKNCSTGSAFVVLHTEERRIRQWLVLCVQSVLWQVQLQTMNCWHDLVFSLLVIAACVFSLWVTSFQCVGYGP